MTSESSAGDIRQQARDATVGSNEQWRIEWDKQYRDHMRILPPNMYGFRPSDIPQPNRAILPIIDLPEPKNLSLGDLHFRTFDGLVRSMFVLPHATAESKPIDLVGVLPKNKIPEVRILWTKAKLLHRNGEPIFTQDDLSRMQMSYELAAAITGGSDNLLGVARTLQALIVRRRYDSERIALTYDSEGQMKSLFHHNIDTKVCLAWFNKLDEHFRNFSTEDIGEARKFMLAHPNVFLAYVIDKLAGAMSNPNASIDPQFIEHMEDFFVKAQQVNMGRTNDSNNLTYANINDAISLIKEWWASQFPFAYALGREVVDTKNDLQYWSRWNSAFLSLLHMNFIAGEGLVPKEAFENGSAIARGNAKSGASDFTEACLRNGRLGAEIDRLAEALHIRYDPVSSDAIPSVTVANTRRHFVLMNIILEKAYKEGVGIHEADVKRLIADFRETMMSMEYYTRSLVSVAEPSQLDVAINYADRAVQRYDAKMKQRYGIGITAFGAVDGIDYHWKHFYSSNEIHQMYNGAFEAPSNFAIDFLGSVEQGFSPYMMFAVHLPTVLMQENGRMWIHRLTPEELPNFPPDQVVPLEILINLEEWLFFSGPHRPEWEARGVGTSGISQDLINEILEIVKRRVAQKDRRTSGDRRHMNFPNMITDDQAGLGAHLRVR